MTNELSFRPIKRNLWTDFEELFGPNGACAGCWCMFWKLRGQAYEEARGYETRQMHKSIVDSGTVTGLLAYLHGEVVGWIAVEPREAYPRLAHSRTLQPVDEQPVWSVTCFFVAKKSRRKGITVELLRAAVEYVKQQGGKIVEGYPVDAHKDMPAPFIYTGTASAFQQAGFKEVVPRADKGSKRLIFRFFIEE
ncbi:MAG TPA: GNAT family N-acetyltransferase [Anaerolineales bacterium]|nr:GNAT family N-acetyltransferase [Anaerolineales bacterium]